MPRTFSELSPDPRPALDLAGAVLTALWLSWIAFIGLVRDGDPRPTLWLIAGCAGAVVTARAIARRSSPLTVPLLVLIAALLIGFASRGSVLSGYAYSQPFHYSNANAAFFVQAAVAGLMVAAVAKARWQRIAALLVAIACAAVPVSTDVKAGIVLLAVLPALAATTLRVRGARPAVAICGAAVCLAVLATVALAAAYTPDRRANIIDRTVDATISEVRPRLWHEALLITAAHPALGAGPGGFARESPTARDDVDARRAHNEFLEHTAEFGIIGGVLMVAAFGWGFVRLAAQPRADTFAVLAAVSLAALGVHAAIDYILHFPAVPLTAAGLLGAATAVRTEPE